MEKGKSRDIANSLQELDLNSNSYRTEKSANNFASTIHSSCNSLSPFCLYVCNSRFLYLAVIISGVFFFLCLIRFFNILWLISVLEVSFDDNFL